MKDEPVIYRNFIEGAGNRGIAVGYPGGVNLAWSAESMNLALIWRGAFIDAGRHWNSRGGGHETPLGYDVLRPTGEVTPALFTSRTNLNPNGRNGTRQTASRASSGKATRSTKNARPPSATTGTTPGLRKASAAAATAIHAGGDPTLTRTVKISGTLPAQAWFRIAMAGTIENKDGVFLCQDGVAKFRVTAPGARIAGRNLVIPARPGTMTLAYQWAE